MRTTQPPCNISEVNRRVLLGMFIVQIANGPQRRPGATGVEHEQSGIAGSAAVVSAEGQIKNR